MFIWYGWGPPQIIFSLTELTWMTLRCFCIWWWWFDYQSCRVAESSADNSDNWCDSIWLCQFMCLHHLHLEICLSLTSLCQIVRTIRSSGSMKKSNFVFSNFPWSTSGDLLGIALDPWHYFVGQCSSTATWTATGTMSGASWVTHTQTQVAPLCSPPPQGSSCSDAFLAGTHFFFGMGAVKVSVWIWCCKHVCLKRMLL